MRGRLHVQTWRDCDREFVAYIPSSDTYAEGPSELVAVERALRFHQDACAEEATPVSDLSDALAWKCICGVENLPGRTECCECGNPRL